MRFVCPILLFLGLAGSLCPRLQAQGRHDPQSVSLGEIEKASQELAQGFLGGKPNTSAKSQRYAEISVKKALYDHFRFSDRGVFIQMKF